MTFNIEILFHLLITRDTKMMAARTRWEKPESVRLTRSFVFGHEICGSPITIEIDHISLHMFKPNHHFEAKMNFTSKWVMCQCHRRLRR